MSDSSGSRGVGFLFFEETEVEMAPMTPVQVHKKDSEDRPEVIECFMGEFFDNRRTTTALMGMLAKEKLRVETLQVALKESEALYVIPTPEPCPKSCDGGKIQCHNPSTNEEWEEDCPHCGELSVCEDDNAS